MPPRSGVKKRRPRKIQATSKAANYKLYRRVKPYIEANMEHKFELQTISPSPTSASFSKNLINGLSRGTNRNERVGNQIFMKRFQYKATITLHSSDTSASLRCLLVFDKQSNDAVFGDTDLLFNASVVGLWNYNEKGRFHILYDKTFTLSDSGNKETHIFINKKLNHKTQYNNANNGTIADIDQGSLYLVWMSNEAINLPAVTGESVLYYIDA